MNRDRSLRIKGFGGPSRDARSPASRICILFMSLFFLGACGNGGAGAPGPAADVVSMGDPHGAGDFLTMGYAEVDISPPMGFPLGGYGIPGGMRVAEGVHDPMYAQVAFFLNGQQQAFVIITVDAVGYSYDFGDWGPGVEALRLRIAEAVQDRVSLEPEHVLVASSHSHGAADLVGFWHPYNQGPDKAYLESVVSKIAAASVQALADARRGTLFSGHAELAGYSGRDDGCSQVIDNRLDILHFVDTEGAALLTIAGYAKHPTLMGEDNTLVTADYIWGYREEMRRQTDAPAMFLQGFIAAVHGGSLSVAGDGWDEAYNMGKIIADKVVETLPVLRQARRFDIAHKWATYACQVRGLFTLLADRIFHVLKRDKEDRGCSVWVNRIEVSWHRLGPVQFVAMPGEPTPEYAVRLRDRIPQEDDQFIVGLANDEIGYIVDPESLAADPSGRLFVYETQMGLGLPSGPAAWEALEALLP